MLPSCPTLACQNNIMSSRDDVFPWVQAGKGGLQPALRIVSFQADSTNRGPAFDMDLADFLHDGEPISYEDARKYFARDPPVR
jgi:hypothetical protein